MREAVEDMRWLQGKIWAVISDINEAVKELRSDTLVDPSTGLLMTDPPISAGSYVPATAGRIAASV